jgi:hypothetical protein
MMVAAPAVAADAQTSASSSAAQPAASSAQDTGNLPVSLDKIKEALAQTPAQPLRGLDEKPHFKIGVSEKQTFTFDDLLATMDFKGGPVVAGGLYAYELNRQAFPAVDNPLRQPYAAFNQAELLTIVIENLAAKYLGGRALSAVSDAERARAEQAARDEVQRALADFRAAQQTSGPKR